MSTDSHSPQPAAPCKFAVRRTSEKSGGVVLEVQTSGVTMTGSLTQAEALGLAMMLQFEVREQLFAAQQPPTEFVYAPAQRPVIHREPKA